jgi:hypothetical protein
MGYSRAGSLSLLRARWATDSVGFCQRRFDLLAISGMLCNRGWKLPFSIQCATVQAGNVPGW